MYKTIRADLHWPSMEDAVYYTVTDFCLCDEKKGTTYGHQKNHRLFLPKGQLELVAMGSLGPLQKDNSGNQFDVMITD